MVTPGTVSRRPPYFQIPNSSVELSHSLPVAQFPHSAARAPALQLVQALTVPWPPFLFSSVSAPSLQCLSCKVSLGHTLPRPSAPFSLGLSLCSPCRYPAMDPVSHLHFLCPSPSWMARERHALRLIDYYQSEVSNLRHQ